MRHSLLEIGLKLRGVEDIPSQRIVDLVEASTHLQQLSCIVDSCMIAASYETFQAQKGRRADASTLSEELQAQVSLPSDADLRSVLALRS